MNHDLAEIGLRYERILEVYDIYKFLLYLDRYLRMISAFRSAETVIPIRHLNDPSFPVTSWCQDIRSGVFHLKFDEDCLTIHFKRQIVNIHRQMLYFI